MPRKQAISLRTAVGEVPPGETVFRRYRVPFPFTIAYLRIELYIGQMGLLRTYVRVGPSGDSSDKVAYKVAEGSPEYYMGDGSVIEFLGLTEEYPADWYLTAQYTNTSTVDSYTGCVDVVVQEVEVRK
jgi:hypothetical protein